MAGVHPVVAPYRLRLASRAMTCFVRLTLRELPAPILAMSINDLATWYHSLNDIKCTRIGEANCKDQYNKIGLDRRYNCAIYGRGMVVVNQEEVQSRTCMVYSQCG